MAGENIFKQFLHELHELEDAHAMAMANVEKQKKGVVRDSLRGIEEREVEKMKDRIRTQL